MGGLNTLIKFIFSFAITVIILYFLAAFLDILPQDFKPSVLFAPQYKSMETHLKNDADSTSSTARLSKGIYDFLNPPEAEKKPSTAQQNTPGNTTSTTGNNPSQNKPQNSNQQQESTSANPVDKAKESMQNYQKAIDNEQKTLNNL